MIDDMTLIKRKLFLEGNFSFSFTFSIKYKKKITNPNLTRN